MGKTPPDKRVQTKHWLGRALLVGLLATTVLGIWTLWTLSGRYNQMIYAPDRLPEMPDEDQGDNQVAIVFGAGYWPSGALSLILQERLDAAIELYKAGRVRKLLFSGDNRIVEYNEPGRMLTYALEQGIPREDIILDYAGRRTYDTCYRARDIFGLSRATLVTQRYHLPRALATCSALGIDVIGYSANRYQHQVTYMVRYRLREIPALWLAWWETRVTHPMPVLGEPLPIFGG